MRILFIGAHIDDIEIGCGGVLIKHVSKGDEVLLAITESDEFLTGDPSARMCEQTHVIEILSTTGPNVNHVPVYFFDMNYSFTDIVTILDKFKPDRIFTHHCNDTHQAHYRANRIGMSVGRKAEIETYLYDSGSCFDFNPNIFFPMTYNMFSSKMALVRCFQSQVKNGHIKIKDIIKRNAYWGSKIFSNEGHKYAEGFFSYKVRYNYE